MLRADPVDWALLQTKALPPGRQSPVAPRRTPSATQPANTSPSSGLGDFQDHAGHRIFVNREANNAHVLVTNSTTGWSILDCNATADHTAELATNQAGIYDIYVRILGKPGGHIKICADTFADFLSGETLCLLGTIDLTRKNPSRSSRWRRMPCSTPASRT